MESEIYIQVTYTGIEPKPLHWIDHMRYKILSYMEIHFIVSYNEMPAQMQGSNS